LPRSRCSDSADGPQEERIFNEEVRKASLTDDVEFTRTREYTTTIELLRLLYNTLVRIIESWEGFDDGEVQYFDIRDNEDLGRRWESYFASIQRNMTELWYLRRTIQQRIDALDSKKNGVGQALRPILQATNLLARQRFNHG